MVYDSQQLTQEYRAGLAGYLAKMDEAALAQAYEIGRQAIGAGMGLLEIVGLHPDILRELSAGQPNSAALEKALAAHEFLVECVAPWEMTHRGFQNANTSLQQLNQTLERLVTERTAELDNQARRLRAQLRRVRNFQREMQVSMRPAAPHTSIYAVASAVERDNPDLRSHSSPDGTITILFSDIEGSTALIQRLGDQKAQELLRAHNVIVRRQTQTYQGLEVKSLGDGFMLAFSSGRLALQCAVDIMRELARYNDMHPEEPIRVRMGANTGEPVWEEGDFFGKSVIVAARIADQALGEEILASSLLKELVESFGDIRFGEERVVALQGLAGTSRVYQVYWE